MCVSTYICFFKCIYLFSWNSQSSVNTAGVTRDHGKTDLFMQTLFSCTVGNHAYTVSQKLFLWTKIWAPNQHTKMISERSCDTKDCWKGCWILLCNLLCHRRNILSFMILFFFFSVILKQYFTTLNYSFTVSLVWYKTWHKRLYAL